MMNAELKDYLAKVKLGEPQTHKHITIVPLIGPTNGEPNYLTLAEALETGQFTVTEVSQGGSVPELKVINRLAESVLLLDGEELLGAKQNRVLSTTILLKESSETVVPVSCTEQGRWAYSSAAFSSSDVIMAHRVRSRQSRSVARSLEMGSPHQSDQGEVWAGIADLHQMLGSSSPTGAMHDAYVQRQADLDAALKSFTCVTGQSGLLVLLDGEVAGFDTVSRPAAYAKLHLKLLKSYVIEALAESKDTKFEAAQAHDRARAFLDETGECEEQRFPSIGHGEDCRFKKPGMAGTALVHGKHTVHAAFFRMSPADESGRISTLQHRRQRLEE